MTTLRSMPPYPKVYPRWCIAQAPLFPKVYPRWCIAQYLSS